MKKRSSYWQLTPYLLLRRNLIAIGFFWVIISNAFWPVLAWIAGQISQYVGSDVSMLIKLSLLACFVFILQGFSQYGQSTSMAKAAYTIVVDLRERVYAHLLSLGSGYFVQIQVGDLSYRITGDIERVGDVINNMLYQFIPSVLQLIVVLIYMSI
jgi:ATP-binding cassette subfamily B protein